MDAILNIIGENELLSAAMVLWLPWMENQNLRLPWKRLVFQMDPALSTKKKPPVKATDNFDFGALNHKYS